MVWVSLKADLVAGHMQKTVLASGERIDCGSGCYIETLPPNHGHPVFRSCGPNCGMAFYANNLEEAERNIEYLKIGH